MAICNRCFREFNGLRRLWNFNENVLLCHQCERDIAETVGYLNKEFTSIATAGFPHDRLAQLVDFAYRHLNGLFSEAHTNPERELELVNSAAQSFLHEMLDSLRKEEFAEPAKLSNFRILCHLLTDSQRETLESRLHLTQLALQTSHGILPVLTRPDVPIKAGETCHLSINVSSYSGSDDRRHRDQGTLLVTNHRLVFLGKLRNWDIPWDKVISIKAQPPRKIQLQLLAQRGNGYYSVLEPVLVAEVLNNVAHLVRDATTATDDDQAGHTREYIPESVRVFVWRRDGGRCVKCGSQTKLEYDHIIPVSRGGSNTARNIQLLCEKCNREKGASVA